MVELPGHRRLWLSATRGIWCLVDEEHWDWISQWRWNWGWHNRTPWKFYAKRNVGAARSTVYLHRELMKRIEPHDDDFYAEHVVDHINGQSLDNRAVNLCWTTDAMNRAKALRRHQIPSLDVIVTSLRPAPAEIPF